MLSCVEGFLALPKQQPALIAHYSVNPLVINLPAINLQPGPDPSIAIGGSIFNHTGNGILEVCVVSSWWLLSQISPLGGSRFLGQYVAARYA